MENQDVIYSINGPIVAVKNSCDFSMMEVVFVGKERLVSGIIGITDKVTTIQVYEETTGLRLGEPAFGTGSPMNVTLGPGILDNIFGGVERPLKKVADDSGSVFISRGSNVPALGPDLLWEVTVTVQVGDGLKGDAIYAECPETKIIQHGCLVPPPLSGVVMKVAASGKYRTSDTVIELTDAKGNKHELTLCQRWPIRTPRPVTERIQPRIPLITGQRVVDTLFPVAEGDTAAIPGRFGGDETMTQHQLAKWCDVDIIICVGCGECDDEMAQVLQKFSELIGPESGRSMADRITLIVNTSDMPVAARGASIYIGIILAGYYHDMGYHMAMMADSIPRQAEALREISGRLEEMPAKKGFPAYLPSRLAEFYERVSYTKNLNGTDSSVTIINAVSPASADFSEPVTQNTKRFTRCFWALGKNLTYAGHYPAINWMASYSEYSADLQGWFRENAGEEFLEYHRQTSNLLQEESKLMEIVKPIGLGVLPNDQKLVTKIARLIRVDLLQQNVFHAKDTFVPLGKQKLMMKVILHLYQKARQLITASVPISSIMQVGLFDKLVKIKCDVPNDRLDLFDNYIAEIDNTVADITNN